MGAKEFCGKVEVAEVAVETAAGVAYGLGGGANEFNLVELLVLLAKGEDIEGWCGGAYLPSV